MKIIKSFQQGFFTQFLIVFFLATMVVTINGLLAGRETFAILDIFILMLMALCTSFASVLFYVDLQRMSRLKMALRRVLHFIVIVGITFLLGLVAGWITLELSFATLRYMAFVVGVYILVTLLMYAKYKKEAKNMEEKLKEKFAKKEED